METGIISNVKSLLVPDISKVRRVPLGLYKGINFNINLKSQTQLLLGLWERETYGDIRRVAPKVNWFIDVGAGKGELCIYFKKINPSCRVLAIEPSEGEADDLIENL